MSDPSHPSPPQPGLEGAVPSLATPAERQAALDQAFDYRGDVTLHTADGQSIEGYVFDRRQRDGQPCVRLLPRAGGPAVTIPYAAITRLAFTGKDTAAGKSWETWARKYRDKKAAGEQASIESEPIE